MGHLQCDAKTSTMTHQKSLMLGAVWNAPSKTQQTDQRYQENNTQLQMRRQGRGPGRARRFFDGNSYFLSSRDVESKAMCLSGIIQQLQPGPGYHSQAWAETVRALPNQPRRTPATV